MPSAAGAPRNSRQVAPIGRPQVQNQAPSALQPHWQRVERGRQEAGHGVPGCTQDAEVTTPSARPPRPSGTVTFLFSDVEGSTRLLKQLRDRYGAVLSEHQRLLREAFAAHGGEEVDSQGDACFYVFPRAHDAAVAAADAQRSLAAHVWPDDSELRVRIGMHTAEPVISEDGRYHGMGVHRAARIMAAGHGAQVLASQATASVLFDDELDGIALRDLGEHELKDFDRPERIYQLDIDGLTSVFPPLQTSVPRGNFELLAASLRADARDLRRLRRSAGAEARGGPSRGDACRTRGVPRHRWGEDDRSRAAASTVTDWKRMGRVRSVRTSFAESRSRKPSSTSTNGSTRSRTTLRKRPSAPSEEASRSKG